MNTRGGCIILGTGIKDMRHHTRFMFVSFATLRLKNNFNTCRLFFKKITTLLDPKRMIKGSKRYTLKSEAAKKTFSCSKASDAPAYPAWAWSWPGRAVCGPGQSEPALRSGPWPRPSTPRAFSNLRAPLYTREPARVGSDRMGGANGPPGCPAPLGLAARGRLPPPTPAKNTSRLHSPAAGSAAPPPPQLESPALPATSTMEPREPRRAPPLKSTGARSLALSIRQWGPPRSRAHRTVEAGDSPRPYCLHARIQAEAHSWPRPLPTKPRPRGAGTKAEAPPEPHTKDERPCPPGLGAPPRPSSVLRWRPAAFQAAAYPAISATRDEPAPTCSLRAAWPH